MIEQEIYDLWKLTFPDDLRYLRPDRWRQLRLLISNRLRRVLEFGAGISTILFDSLNLQVTSYETNKSYLEVIKSLCHGDTKIHHWNNLNPLPKPLGTYGLAFVDGAEPRDTQLAYSIKHSIYVAIDDYRGLDKERFEPFMSPYKRLDDESTPLAIFKVKDV
jgi:hypothetical protein